MKLLVKQEYATYYLKDKDTQEVVRLDSPLA
jgi:hypothetical protein